MGAQFQLGCAGAKYAAELRILLVYFAAELRILLVYLSESRGRLGQNGGGGTGGTFFIEGAPRRTALHNSFLDRSIDIHT